MSIDRRLREGLLQSADALAPDALAALHAVERKARLRRRRVVVAQLAAAALAVALVVVALPWSVGQLRGGGTVAQPSRTTEVVGTYVVDVGESDVAQREGMVGRWVIELSLSGEVNLTPPDSFSGSGAGTTYVVQGAQLRTNVFVNDMCGAAGTTDPVGTYQWARTATTLQFTVVTDSCEGRRLLFAGQSWEDAS